jgi:hypothetical protein
MLQELVYNILTMSHYIQLYLYFLIKTLLQRIYLFIYSLIRDAVSTLD